MKQITYPPVSDRISNFHKNGCGNYWKDNPLPPPLAMALVTNKEQTQFTVLLRNNQPMHSHIVSNTVGSKLSSGMTLLGLTGMLKAYARNVTLYFDLHLNTAYTLHSTLCLCAVVPLLCIDMHKCSRLLTNCVFFVSVNCTRVDELGFRRKILEPDFCCW